jgi:hypothetical protein
MSLAQRMKPNANRMLTSFEECCDEQKASHSRIFIGSSEAFA